MKIAIISYSYTGNNAALAKCVARELSAKHIKVTVKKPVTMGTIIADMAFNRTPKVQPAPDILRQYDLVLFFAPVWMGKLASPLRAYLRYLKAYSQSYGFLSISGGADGDNPKLYRELLKRTGAEPVIILDQHIRDLISSDLKPARKDTSAYKISKSEAERLTTMIMKELSNLSIKS